MDILCAEKSPLAANSITVTMEPIGTAGPSHMLITLLVPVPSRVNVAALEKDSSVAKIGLVMVIPLSATKVLPRA